MKFVGSFLILAALIIFTIVIVKGIQFNQSCGGNLKRAADANTVEIAKEELKTALDYIEANGLTTGYTSVLWKTPDEDIGFWYKNLKTSYSELDSLPDNSSSLEKSNMLIKLRETLIDHGKTDSVTVPNGISRYPQNGLWGTLIWAAIIFMLFGIGILTVEFN